MYCSGMQNDTHGPNTFKACFMSELCFKEEVVVYLLKVYNCYGGLVLKGMI